MRLKFSGPTGVATGLAIAIFVGFALGSGAFALPSLGSLIPRRPAPAPAAPESNIGAAIVNQTGAA